MAVDSVNGTHPMDANADTDNGMTRHQSQRMTTDESEVADGRLDKMGMGAAAAGEAENMVASEALPPSPVARAGGRNRRVTYPQSTFVDEPDRNLPYMNLSGYESDGMGNYETQPHDVEGSISSNISADFSALRTISVSACPGTTVRLVCAYACAPAPAPAPAPIIRVRLCAHHTRVCPS